MYVIYPKNLIFLAEPKTGSRSFADWLRSNFRFPSKYDGVTQLNGHHNVPVETLEEFKSQGFRVFCTIRNPWDHYVSWYHYLLKRGPKVAMHALLDQTMSFDEFVRGFDTFQSCGTHADLENYPHRVQWRSALCDDHARFENLTAELSRIMQMPVTMGHENKAQDRKPYREYYTPELADFVARRNKDFILDFNYTF